METWQLIFVTVVLLLPFALLTGFWPHRERLTVAGRPLHRDWRPKGTAPTPTDHH